MYFSELRSANVSLKNKTKYNMLWIKLVVKKATIMPPFDLDFSKPMGRGIYGI